MASNEARAVRVVEVGPRDGLQNESRIVPTAAKIAFVNALADVGLTDIEATSFVNPKAVPQLADADEVMRGIARKPGVRYSALVPNTRGLERALAAGVDSIALFTSATDAFCTANIQCTVDESFDRFLPVVERALEQNVRIRGYVSVAFDCPYSGKVSPEAAVSVAVRLFELGCAEVSIADTIGTAIPTEVDALLDVAERQLPLDQCAFHFHDTRGQAIANVATAFGRGIEIFDAAAGGLGGCPFAPGAPGNLATEVLVDFLKTRGHAAEIDLAAIHGAVAALKRAMELSVAVS